MTILAAAAAGVILPFASAATVQADGIRRTIAAKLAADLMEDIRATTFTNIVATWNGYSEAQGQVKDVNGTVFADDIYAKFSRTAAAQQLSGGPFTAIATIRVTVNVYYDGILMAHVYTLMGAQ